MKKWRKKLRRELLRPTVYAASTRFLTALTAALLLDWLLGNPLEARFKSFAFLFAAFFFAALAWIAYLRLDGVSLPKLMMKRVNIRKKPVRSYGDMIDYVDEQPPLDYDDLDDEEKDLCLLGADLICCVLFLVLAILF